MMDLHALLLKRAGIGRVILEKGRVDPEFNEIAAALMDIHRGKEVFYGNYMETHGRDPLKFALMEHYADIKRKFVRAETFIKIIMNDQDVDLVELLDTYSDMAVYAMMGIQMINHHMEKKSVQSRTSESTS